MIGSPAVLLDVPFASQEKTGLCGVTCLEMIFRYHGVAASSDKIEEEVFIPALEGTVAGLLVACAGKRGLDACRVGGDMQQLKQWLERGIPPIVFLAESNGSSKGHFAVVTGLSRGSRRIRLHSGARKDVWFKRDVFLGLWRAGEYATVVITGSEK